MASFALSAATVSLLVLNAEPSGPSAATAVGTETRSRIEACKDAATLDQWIARAAMASSAEEVIAASPEPE
jgi:hypothetical protein